MRALDSYLAKRNFDDTPEPYDAGSPAGLALRYSMQKHAATRLHFDLRLEWDGVLLSWAVTRGPSFIPSEKRLAVRTEDHPISYLGFEGVIPKGNYGAGSVMLFDIGHWSPVIPVGKGLEKGHLHFRLHGRRLTGGWHLVRMEGRKSSDRGRENWLFMKEEDEASKARDPVRRYTRSVSSRRTLREITSGKAEQPLERLGKLPRFHKVQLASNGESVMSGGAWWHELKFDGYRAVVALGKSGPRIHTRNGHDWSDRFRSLLPSFDAVECDAALIDGEIVAGAGLDGFSNLQRAIKFGGPFRFYAFDLLALDEQDLKPLPLNDRREALEKLLKPMPSLGSVDLSPVIRGGAVDAFTAVCSAGGEGLMAKRYDLPYRSGRSSGWLKVKCKRRDEFVILGWQESDKRGRAFASLLLAEQTNDGLIYRGKVGTGFDFETMTNLAALLKANSRKSAPTEVPKDEAVGVVWVTPKFLAEVQYTELTAEGRLRHSVYLGLREDLQVDLQPVENTDAKQGSKVRGVMISSPDRIVYPGLGISKLEVASYYEEVADKLLSTAANRPLSLLRLPEGLPGERFFQKHRGAGFGEDIKRVSVPQSDGELADYMYVDSAAGLVAAAQMGTLEFHVWGARRDLLERPDRLVFDLDPDESLPFSEVRSAAYDLRDSLAELGLKSAPLLTGGKGVHIVVPLKRTVTWETMTLFSRVFAQVSALREPKRFVAEMSKAKRRSRIFIDWLRNERGATAIAPYSLRAREGAPVALPVSWSTLEDINSGAALSLRDFKSIAPPPGWLAPQTLSKSVIARLETWASAPRRG